MVSLAWAGPASSSTASASSPQRAMSFPLSGEQGETTVPTGDRPAEHNGPAREREQDRSDRASGTDGAGGSTGDQRDGSEIEPGAREQDDAADREDGSAEQIAQDPAGHRRQRRHDDEPGDSGPPRAEADGGLLGGAVGAGQDVARH